MATDLSTRVFKETRRAVDKFHKHSERELRRIKNLYIGARKRISGEIAEQWPNIVKEGATPFGLERLKGLQLGIDTQLGVLNQDLNNMIPQMVGDAGDMGIYRGQVELAQLLREFPDLHPTFGVLNTSAIDVYSGYALQLSQQYTAELTRQIQSALQMGLIDQKTTGELTTQIRQYLGAEFGKPAKKITYHAQTIARTEMSRAYQAGHEAYGRSTDFVVGEKWHVNPMAIWPCAECEVLEGNEYDYEKGEERPPIPLHPRCYSEDTEIYTSDGWKFFKDLNGQEKILSLNPKSFDLEWLPYIGIVSYRFKGKLYYLKNRWFSLKVTPDHQHLFGRRIDPKDRKKLKWEIKSTKDMIKYSEFRIPRTAKWKGISPEFIDINGLKIKTEVFCRFLGFYLSEGSMTIRKQSCYQMSIAQSPNGLNEIYNDISEMPVKLDKGKDHIYCFNKKLGTYLLQFGKSSEKFIPDDIKRLSSKLIRVFLLAYCKGDGHSRVTTWEERHLASKEYVFTTSSPRMAGDLGELILRAGGYPSYSIDHRKGKLQKFKNGIYRINNDQHRISWNKSNTATFPQPEWIQEIDYNGYVYDVELPRNHILWVRHDGKTCFSGNCRCYSTFLYSKKLFTKEEMGRLKGMVPSAPPVKGIKPPFKTGNRMRYLDNPKTITSNIGKDPKMKEAMAYSKKTGKEIGYQINRADDGSLILGQKTEGFKGSLVNARTGDTGFFHTHPDKTVVDGFSRSDFARMLTDKNTQVLAIRNTEINRNGWIAVRTKNTPVMTARKSVAWQIKGKVTSAPTKEKFIEKYVKPLLGDLKKENVRLYYGDLSGRMKVVETWADYQKVVLGL